MFHIHLRAHCVCEARHVGVSVSEGFLWRVVLEKMNNTPVYEANGARVRNLWRSQSEFISIKNEFKRVFQGKEMIRSSKMKFHESGIDLDFKKDFSSYENELDFENDFPSWGKDLDFESDFPKWGNDSRFEGDFPR